MWIELHNFLCLVDLNDYSIESSNFFFSNVIPVLSRNWTYTVAVLFSSSLYIYTCLLFFFGAMIQVLRFFQRCGKETALLVVVFLRSIIKVPTMRMSAQVARMYVRFCHLWLMSYGVMWDDQAQFEGLRERLNTVREVLVKGSFDFCLYLDQPTIGWHACTCNSVTCG
jgi:hypothetical protein